MFDVETFYYLIKPFSAAFFFVAILFLLLRGRENRSRRILAYTQLSWLGFYVMWMVKEILGIPQRDYVEYHIFDPNYMLGGSFYMLISCFYVIEVILPGWLNLKRVLMILSPYFLLLVVYWGGIALLGETVEHVYTYEELWQSLGHFNVWFRAVILLFMIINGCYLLRFIYVKEKSYEKWLHDSYADNQNMDMSWMRYYAWMLFLVSIAYIGNITTGHVLSYLIHNIVALFCFGLVVYKALFYESPYTEGFFALSSDQSVAVSKMDQNEVAVLHDEHLETMTNDTFVDKMPIYVDKFQTWMNDEKPFLYKDFKLTDVGRILPLNRSYLSRVFNEGMGMNFSEVVRNYRLEYAKYLLSLHPTLTSARVAELSGFSSAAVFNRTFTRYVECTPKQYRDNVATNPKMCPIFPPPAKNLDHKKTTFKQRKGGSIRLKVASCFAGTCSFGGSFNILSRYGRIICVDSLCLSHQR